MTKIVSTTALHYGKHYLGDALRSVVDYVDEVWVIYSHIGSHGARSEQPCPESRGELYAIARDVAGTKLHWSDGIWNSEGTQREMIYTLAPTADVILSVDADEVWQPGLPARAITQALDGTVRHYRVPFRHYWRTFSKCILHDPAFPVRVTNPKRPLSESYLDAAGLAINHFGYALPPSILEYKMKIHGHRGQWRTDCDWFRDKYLANAQTDCHPVGSQYWNPETVDPWLYLPKHMKLHPFAGMELIDG